MLYYKHVFCHSSYMVLSMLVSRIIIQFGAGILLVSLMSEARCEAPPQPIAILPSVEDIHCHNLN